MKPITIKRGAFKAHLYEVRSLMELPLANVRRLWKLMLEYPWENAEALSTIKEWLPVVVIATQVAVDKEQERLMQVLHYARALLSTVASFGSVATKNQKAEIKEASAVLRYAEKRAKDATIKHDRAKKLQSLFNEMNI